MTIMVMDAPTIAPTVTIMVTVEGLGQDVRTRARLREGGTVDTDVSGVGETGEETAVAPVRQRYMDFYGDGIPLAEAPNGELYVALRPVTDVLGLAFSPQRRRVLRDEALIRAHAGALMAAAVARRRGRTSVWCGDGIT